MTGCVGPTCPPPDCVFGVNCPPTPTDIDLALVIGENNPNNPYGPYNFTIGVRNLGNAINTSQPITVTDVVPAGMTFTNVTSSNWTCTPNPVIPSGGTLTCTYSGSFPIAANQALGWITIVATGGDGPFENCASLAPGDGDSSNDRACVTVKTDKVGELIVKKVVHTFSFVMNGPYPVTVTCGSNVTNLSLMNGVPQSIGTIPYQTQCTVAETGSPPFPSGVCQGGKIPGWVTTYAPTQPVTINQVTTTVTVDNQFQCTGGGDTYVLVSKTIKTNPGLPLSTFSNWFPGDPHLQRHQLPRQRSVRHTAGRDRPRFRHTCSASETGPMPALPTTGCATAGEVPTWTMPPNYLPASVQTPNGGMGPTLTVENNIECKPAGGGGGTILTVTKQVINQTDPQILTTGMTFTGNVSCVSGMSPAVVTPFSLTDGASQTFTNIASGATCTITEDTPVVPSGSCPNSGDVLAWGQVVPAPVLMGNSPQTVTIQNYLACKPSGGGTTYVLVSKTIKNNPGLPLSTFSNMVFPVTVTCNGTSYPVNNLTFGTPKGVTGLASGITCSANETGPMPALPTTGCATAGEVPTWRMPPNYLPSSVQTPNGGMGPTLTVENNIDCKPAGAGGTTSITVTKHVTNRTNPQISVAGLTYTGSVNCVLGSSPPGGGPFSLSDGSSQTFNNLAIGAACTVQENPPPPPPISVISCRNPGDVPVWTTSTPATVTLGSSPAAVTIENFLDCKPGGSQIGQILVKKQVTSAKPVPLTAMNYPVTVTCGGQVTNLSLSSDGTPQSVGGISMPSTCSVTENTSTLPNVCPQGTTATWSSPSISPNPISVSPGPIVTVTVTNTVDCSGPPPPACKPPMVPGAGPGGCVCPSGTTLVDDKCVQPPACRPPMVPGSAPGSCVCPSGTTLVNGKCVTPTACKPPMVPGAGPGGCVCPPGTTLRGGRCIEPITCRAPARPNGSGTACVCPENLQLKNGKCVERERRGPAVSPGDVIRNVPGIIGPGGGRRSPGGPVGPSGGGGGGYVPPGGGGKGGPGGAIH